MIENDLQRQRTPALIEGFRKAGAKLANDELGKRLNAIRGSYEAIIRQLENEIRNSDVAYRPVGVEANLLKGLVDLERFELSTS